MSRLKITNIMIDFLESKLNCENVMKFIDKQLDKTNNHTINKLLIDTIPVSLQITYYDEVNSNHINSLTTIPTYSTETSESTSTDENINSLTITSTDSIDEVEKKVDNMDENIKITTTHNRINELSNNSRGKNRLYVQNLFQVFDFITEANHNGFEYFPYLYGVLDCHNKENSKVYTFYEFFDYNLSHLFENMEHVSEWYDVVFQMVMINYYIQGVSRYNYNNGTVQNHLYRKLSKPYYKEYELNNKITKINHKYLIVLWNIDHMEKILNDNINKLPSNIDYLIDYIEQNKSQMKFPPSFRIIKLLNEVKVNPDNSLIILDRYYNINE